MEMNTSGMTKHDSEAVSNTTQRNLSQFVNMITVEKK
jgi:hypothetical protein